MIRLIIRLGILALAAFGAKSLYDRLAPHGDQLKTTGSEFVDRAGSAAREVGSKVSDASQSVAVAAKSGLDEVKSTAVEQAAEVKSAADDAANKASEELAADGATTRDA
jgi:2-hydroxychromene-2-carboxylate isomerase